MTGTASLALLARAGRVRAVRAAADAAEAAEAAQRAAAAGGADGPRQRAAAATDLVRHRVALLQAYTRAANPLRALHLLTGWCSTFDAADTNRKLVTPSMFNIVAKGLAHVNDQDAIRRLTQLFEATGQKPNRIFWNILMSCAFSRASSDAEASASKLFSDMHDPSTQYPAPATDTYNIRLRHALDNSDVSLVTSLLATMAASTQSPPLQAGQPHLDIAPNLRTYHILIKRSADLGLPLQTRRHVQNLLDALAAAAAVAAETNGESSWPQRHRPLRATPATVAVLVRAFVAIGDLHAAARVLADAVAGGGVLSGDGGFDDHGTGGEVMRTRVRCRLELLRAFADIGAVEEVLGIYRVVVFEARMRSHVDARVTSQDLHVELEADRASVSEDYGLLPLEVEGGFLGDEERSTQWVVDKANRFLIESLIKAGYLREAATILLGDSDKHNGLVGIVYGIIAKRQRKNKTGDPTHHKSLVAKLFDGNNSVTRTLRVEGGGYVSSTTAFGSFFEPWLNREPTSKPKYSPILQTIFLKQLVAQSKSEQQHGKLIVDMLHHVEECVSRSVPIPPSAFVVVMNQILASKNSEDSFHKFDHTLCSPLRKLYSMKLRSSAANLVAPILEENLLQTMASRARFLRRQISMSLPGALNDVESKSAEKDEASSADAPAANGYLAELRTIQADSWQVHSRFLATHKRMLFKKNDNDKNRKQQYQQQQEQQKPRPRRPLTAVINAMLTIHRESTISVERVMSAHADMESREAFDARTYVHLIDFALRRLQRWELAVQLWELYVQSLREQADDGDKMSSGVRSAAVAEEGRATTVPPDVRVGAWLAVAMIKGAFAYGREAQYAHRFVDDIAPFLDGATTTTTSGGPLVPKKPDRARRAAGERLLQLVPWFVLNRTQLLVRAVCAGNLDRARFIWTRRMRRRAGVLWSARRARSRYDVGPPADGGGPSGKAGGDPAGRGKWDQLLSIL
ncbi:hypothetical protein HDU83_001298 [Entophlyctis luteolus]|nr:hypothetical protein HDU83_001298 [Entophlyctis luteolus]